jgi:hypothetical protein
MGGCGEEVDAVVTLKGAEGEGEAPVDVSEGLIYGAMASTRYYERPGMNRGRIAILTGRHRLIMKHSMRFPELCWCLILVPR